MLPLLLATTLCAGQIRDRTQHPTPANDNNQSQINAKKTKRGPRAIAVLEFLPGGGARLVPIALWIDDRFYDASLYGANPEPMALEPETVYEATNYGESAGLFTVTTPEQVKGSWIATGQWKPYQPLDEKLAKQAATQPKPKPTPSNALDDRPVLRRPGSSGSSSSGDSGASSGSSSGTTTTPNPNEPPDRPTLKKPPSEASTPAPATQPTPVAGGSPPSASTSSPDENNPNRPVLRRGQPAPSAAAPETSQPASTPSNAANQPTQGKLMTTTARVGRRSYPAVSDASPYETRSLLYAMSPSERSDKSEELRALALDKVRKFAAQRNAPAVAKDAAITDYDLRAYDLEYSNSPTLVFTGTLSVPSAKALRGGEFDYFVTVVAREDVNGTPIEIFSSVTDSNHLDAFARMEIIDAVDADANGRGDLLFRLYSDTGISYSLYRVYPYEMKKIFEGGAGV